MPASAPSIRTWTCKLPSYRQKGARSFDRRRYQGGSRQGRVELATIIDFLRPGDELVVTRLDRLGRDTRDVLNLIHECEQRGAFVTVLDPHVTTRGEMGQMILTVLGMVAQMERRFIKERQRDGIELAKTRGTYAGGKRRIDRQRVIDMADTKNTVSAIASAMGCSRMQIYRILKDTPTPK